AVGIPVPRDRRLVVVRHRLRHRVTVPVEPGQLVPRDPVAGRVPWRPALGQPLLRVVLGHVVMGRLRIVVRVLVAAVVDRRFGVGGGGGTSAPAVRGAVWGGAVPPRGGGAGAGGGGPGGGLVRPRAGPGGRPARRRR